MLGTIWFLLWGVLWAVYFMLDGFDLGIGMVMPFASKNNQQKRELLRTIGPFWNGNEVWLITAGGVTFAAFPATYAALFSAFYTPLMVILFALIVRGVSIELREAVESALARKILDTGIFIGSFLPALLFGVAFANIFMGTPLDGEQIFHGTIVTLLNPYGLAGGVLFLLFFLVHGSLWAAWRCGGELSAVLARNARTLWIPLVLIAVLFLVLTAIYTSLWQNYLSMPVLLVIPLIAVSALLYLGHVLYRKNKVGKALVSSFIAIATCVLFGVVGLYPNLLPSSLDPVFSLTVTNSAASTLTLTIMLVVAVITVPSVILYQLWVYRLFLRERKGAVLETGGTASAAV